MAFRIIIHLPNKITKSTFSSNSLYIHSNRTNATKSAFSMGTRSLVPLLWKKLSGVFIAMVMEQSFHSFERTKQSLEGHTVFIPTVYILHYGNW